MVILIELYTLLFSGCMFSVNVYVVRKRLEFLFQNE